MSLVPGYTPLTDTETFTWAKFLLAFTNGSATIGSQGEITPGVVTVATSAPSGKTGDEWFDTSLGSGYGTLRIFDGSDWKAVAEGFIGQNKSGLSVAAGAPMRRDTVTTAALTGSRVPVNRTTAQSDRMMGVAATAMENDGIGIVLTRGKVKIFKDAASITAGDPVVPSATAAQATTNSVGGWGTPFGSSSCGFWLETSAAAAGTLVTAYLTGHTGASWAAFKNAAPTAVFNASAPGVAGDNDKWSGSFATPQFGTFSTAPAGVIARVCQCVITQVTDAAATVARLAFGLRAKNATLTVDTGAAFSSGLFHARGAGTITGQAYRCQLIVQETTASSGNQVEYYFETSGTVTGIRVTVHEVGVIVGGQIV